MPVEVLMPALSPTMTEGTLAKWLKKEGEAVRAGDVIAEIETDKATMEVEAVDEGRIGKILVSAGTQGVAVNTPIAVLLEEGEESVESYELRVSSQGSRSPQPAAQPTTALISQPATRNPQPHNRVFASPLAKRIAGERGIDLSAIKGSGPGGRIVKADVEGGKSVSGHELRVTGISAPSAPATRSPQLATPLSLPNNSIRKVVARRLLESKQTIPHFYLTVECRIDALMEARKRINDEADGAFKLSVNDFVIKACAMALQAYPAANVSWTDDAILQYRNADISVAVSTPNGLITPIIHAAETKGMRTISEEMKDLAARARAGKLKPEEFQGGTFTVSNLGMYGVKEFGAIINPPQSCILAVGAGEERVYAEKGQVKTGMFMTCTLSVDHRSVDGAVGAEYLQVLKRYIENPVSMLV